MIELTEEQKSAHDTIIDWWKSKPKEAITLGGYAGTGKTVTISKIAETMRKYDENNRVSIAFCAYTGKAASVLRSKLTLEDDDYCGTIHALIYEPIIGEGGAIEGWQLKSDIEQDVIIVDEASMISEDIFKDLQSYGKPILAVGDHGQLPPINGSFNLMEKPILRLEKIHRQAETSAIIRLSMAIRTEGRIPDKFDGNGEVEQMTRGNLFDIVNETSRGSKPLYICGFNSTRVLVNKMIRKGMKINSESPVKGDRLICLRNNRKAGIYNGQQGYLIKIHDAENKETMKVSIMMDDSFTFKGNISKFQFGQKTTPKNWETKRLGNLFDFGYALTVHKSQGSESDSVVLILERLPEMDDTLYSRWLYTGITRAKRKLILAKRSS